MGCVSLEKGMIFILFKRSSWFFNPSCAKPIVNYIVNYIVNCIVNYIVNYIVNCRDGGRQQQR